MNLLGYNNFYLDRCLFLLIRGRIRHGYSKAVTARTSNSSSMMTMVPSTPPTVSTAIQFIVVVFSDNG